MIDKLPTVSGGSEPTVDFPVEQVAAYCDTIKFWRRRLPALDLLSTLRRLCGPRLIIEDHYRGSIPWWLIIIQQPTPEELAFVSELPKKWPVCRADIAVDFICSNPDDARRADAFLKHHVLQKWHGKRRVNTVYSSTYFSKDRRAPRNVVIYADKPSKTGLGHCAHLEMRFQTAQACRRAGLDDIRRLIDGIDALGMLKHQTRLVRIDGNHLNRLIEKLARGMKYKPRRGRKRQRYMAMSVEELAGEIRGYLRHALHIDPSKGHELRPEQIYAQVLYDRTRWLRPCLKPVISWDDLIASPDWCFHPNRR